jgi:hypothetical protein
MSPIRFVSCSLALFAIACAGGSQSSSSPEPSSAATSSSAAARTNPDVITQAEIDGAVLGEADGLTIVKQLRPRFLAFRGNVSGSDQTGGGSLQVTVDGGRLSGGEVLSALHGREIQEIRYLSAAAAAQRFGSLSKAGPVIMVRRR